MLEYSWLTMLCYFQVYSKEIQLYIKKEKKKKAKLRLSISELLKSSLHFSFI